MNTTDLATKQPQTIAEWTETLRDQELPIFSNTAQKVHQSLQDENKGAMDLAGIIMQEPNLTATLLKLGNSSYYNPSNQKVNTITRAIILLGAETIRELTLACSFIESILSSSNKARANEEIAQAIHAAVQARELAIAAHDVSPEEVFIAALLHNLGSIAFWCSDSRQSEQINFLIENRGLSHETAEKQVLGFSLRDLSQSLCKSWRFGGLIEESISGTRNKNPRVQMVVLGGEISAALKYGWESAAMRECLDRLRTVTKLETEELKAKIKKNTTAAIRIAKQFGADDASKFIAKEHDSVVVDDIELHQPDKKQIQFEVLQNISNHIVGEINLNMLFEMVLEGIHRGVEMDRTLFLLLSPDKRALNEKMSMGWPADVGRQKIQIRNQEVDGNLFFHALNQKEGIWVVHEHYHGLYTKQITEIIGRFDCFIFPVCIEQKPIGVIYTDRAIGNLPLIHPDFITARHFVKQANIGLTLHNMRRRPQP